MPGTLVAVGLLLGLVPGPGRAAPARFQHAPACVPSHGNAVMHVRLVEPVPVAAVRVYFHAAQQADQGDYYIELRHRGNGEFWGLLPVPGGKTSTVAYRVDVKTADGAEAGSDLVAAPVGADCGARLTPEEGRFARSLVIGQTRPNQSTVPPGFRCGGILSEISVAGELRPNLECRRLTFLP